MKKILLLLVAAILTGCAYYEPVVINQPPIAGNVQVFPKSSDPNVWRPDTTRVIVQNYSRRIFVDVWLGRPPSGQPDLRLEPEQGLPANFRGTGLQAVYIRGREQINKGWRTIGIKERVINVSPVHGDVGEVAIDDSDFYDNVVPSHWRGRW
jgi:hypothetical protein